MAVLKIYVTSYNIIIFSHSTKTVFNKRTYYYYFFFSCWLHRKVFTSIYDYAEPNRDQILQRPFYCFIRNKWIWSNLNHCSRYVLAFNRQRRKTKNYPLFNIKFKIHFLIIRIMVHTVNHLCVISCLWYSTL